MSIRDLLVLGIVFGALPFVLRRPHYGVLLWSWLAFMNPHRMSWGIAYDFPVAMVAGLVTLFSVLVTSEPKKLPVTPVTVTLILFVIWMSISTVFAFSPDAMEGWEKMIKIQLIIFVIIMIMRTRERINQLVWVIVLSLGYFGVKGGVFTILTGGNFRVWGPPGSFIEGNNELALALLVVLPLVGYLYTQEQRKWIKWGLLVSMPLILLSVLGSYSRGAFVGLACMLVIMWLKSRRKFLIGSVTTLVLLGSISFMPEQWQERMETTTTYQEDASAMGRINSWWFAYNLAMDRPLTGGGFGTFEPDLFLIYAPNPFDFHDAHSIYFEVLAEHGFVGLFLFLLLGFLALRNGSWIMRHTAGREDLEWANRLASAVQVGLVGFAAAGAFLGLAYYDLPYNLIAILVVVRGIVSKQLEQEAEALEERGRFQDQRSGGYSAL